MAFLGCLEYSVVDPILKDMCTTTHSHEKAGESGTWLFDLFAFDVAQHRPGEGADEQREYLLEGEHQDSQLKIIAERQCIRHLAVCLQVDRSLVVNLLVDESYADGIMIIAGRQPQRQ